MAREIKFRAWLGGQNRYVGVDAIDFDEDSIRINDEYFFLADLQQYAGLTDKNDKEIYEGDYVKVTSHTPAFCQFGCDKDCEGVVDFLECGFVVTDRKTFARPLFTEICDIEVIGNIYENPELLEVNHD
ncbi:YopX family protein [Wohlfahrtiimonas larvae]|uniref:YopX family protein n=1 Tax=Wohlfahrtiimonas larvae TaxID=1157986 RepID=A0ABP9MSS5_9GAMM|nr:YopX family protein [Wohlfahrtiimonas larvae]